MRLLVAVLCLFSTAAAAEMLVCRPPSESGHYGADRTIAECTRALADKRTPLFLRLETHAIRAQGYKALGDTARELADLDFVIAQGEARRNGHPALTYSAQVEALLRRAEIYQARGMTAKASADRAGIDRVNVQLLDSAR